MPNDRNKQGKYAMYAYIHKMHIIINILKKE